MTPHGRIYDPQYPRALWYRNQVVVSKRTAFRRMLADTVIVFVIAAVLYFVTLR